MFSTQAHAVIPWTPLISCEGPSGIAVLDDFVFTYYGRPVFQQQLVIRSPEINRWLQRQGVVANEVAMNFPDEIIVNLQRTPQEIEPRIASRYTATLGAFNYVVILELPTLSFFVQSRETGAELTSWQFRECSQLK